MPVSVRSLRDMRPAYEGLRTVISEYFHLPPRKKDFVSKEVAGYFSELNLKITEMGLEVVSGSGHRQAPSVRLVLSRGYLDGNV